MRWTARATAAMSIAVLGISVTVSTATALRSLQIGGAETGATATFENLTLKNAEGGAKLLECKVILLRTISRAVPKVEGTLMGSLTGIKIEKNGRPAAMGGCAEAGGGTVTIVPLEATAEANRELYRVNGSTLWRLFYTAIEGTLPNITFVNYNIRTMLFEVRSTGGLFGTFFCLYEGHASLHATVTAERNIVRELVNPLTSGFVRKSGASICPVNGTLEGIGLISPTLLVGLV